CASPFRPARLASRSLFHQETAWRSGKGNVSPERPIFGTPTPEVRRIILPRTRVN
ncbi:MAG: hypothetical protein AVDCRST_MAG22-892, partial [uncultured Rubrobacteraceae bacterium]